MMNNQIWSKDKAIYNLGEGFALEKAHWEPFSVWFATFVVYETNVWFRQSFDASCAVLKDMEICYWIMRDGVRIGGVLIEPNYLNCLFLIPPHSDYNKVVSLLKKLLLIWSDPSRDIVMGGAKPDELPHYLRAGFRPHEARRCMIRPTETFQVKWDSDLLTREPVESDVEVIARLFQTAFAGGVGHRGTSLESNLDEVEAYFKYLDRGEICRRASTLVFDTKNDRLIGACLVGIWENWPLIYDVGVHPDYQGRGLASMMLKQAINIMHKEYPVIRLFVTLGNSAEAVYHNLGFMAGVETTELRIPARR